MFSTDIGCLLSQLSSTLRGADLWSPFLTGHRLLNKWLLKRPWQCSSDIVTWFIQCVPLRPGLGLKKFSKVGFLNVIFWNVRPCLAVRKTLQKCFIFCYSDPSWPHCSECTTWKLLWKKYWRTRKTQILSGDLAGPPDCCTCDCHQRTQSTSLAVNLVWLSLVTRLIVLVVLRQMMVEIFCHALVYSNNIGKCGNFICFVLQGR